MNRVREDLFGYGFERGNSLIDLTKRVREYSQTKLVGGEEDYVG